MLNMQEWFRQSQTYDLRRFAYPVDIYRTLSNETFHTQIVGQNVDRRRLQGQEKDQSSSDVKFCSGNCRGRKSANHDRFGVRTSSVTE